MLDKIGSDGLLPTLEAVSSRLAQPLQLGYCCAGVILELGPDVTGYAVGDRVASNGPHAEIVCVPQNLCAKVPNQVTDEEAAFTVLTSFGFQGMRLANPLLGEHVVVIGLGLLGLLTLQLLVANSCRVLGTHFDAQKLELARHFGAETADLSACADPVAAALAFSGGRGVDAVLITASTKSSDPVHQAAQMSRKRSRIVLIGVTGLELSRADFYEKELTFQVSCSYGPGRYDETYDQRGHDYPLGFVSWTEGRNFAAVLDLIAARQLDVMPLITAHVPIDDAPAAYRRLMYDKSTLGVLLSYPANAAELRRTIPTTARSAKAARFAVGGNGAPVVGVIGAGNFASMVLLPALAKTHARLKTVAGS